MYEKILVAFDRSEAAEHALATAVELAEHGMAKKILVMSVYEPDTEDPTFEVAGRMAGNMKEEVDAETPLQFLRDALASQIEAHPDVIDTVVMRGAPKDIIVDAAKDNGCDLIVMGRRGVSGLAAIGSVSKAVLRDSNLPVLLVR